MKSTALRRLRPLAGLMLATQAFPATAQLAPAAVPSFYMPTKTEAILGTTSALDALLAVQSSARSVAAAGFATAPGGRQLAFLRAPFTVPSAPAFVPASASTPDIFNSVALPVSHTPLDGRWARVAHSTIGGSAGAFAAALASRDESARLEAVNAYVNHRIQFVDDYRQYGVADRWSPAADTLARGRGDCEDYAIAKLAMLRRAGFAERNLYLVILKDLVRRADHAVLVVRSEGHFRVLDNGTDRIADSSQVQDYRPILTFNVARAYTHGYRREVPAVAPAVTMAMAETSAVPVPASPAVNYQSASATPEAWTLPSMTVSTER